MKKWLVLIVVTLVLVSVIVVAVSAQEKEEPAAESSTRPAESAPEWQEERGVLVTGIVADGPAAAAGLRRGDIILALDGQEVDTPAAVQALVREMDAGTQVTLDILRCEQAEDVVVLLGEMDNTGRGYLGVSLFPAVTQEHQSIPLPMEGLELLEPGALVTSVDPGSPARKAGIKPGDLLVAVDGEDVQDSQTLIGMIRSRQPGDTIALTVERNGEELALEATLASQTDNLGEAAYLGVHLAPTMRWRGNLRQFPHGTPAEPGENEFEWLPFHSDGENFGPFDFLQPKNQRPPARDGAEA